MTLKDLAQVALRGTARAGLPKLPGSALTEALARLPTDNPEAALLARAALADLHARAGAALLQAEQPTPETLPPASGPLPEKLWPLLRPLLQPPVINTALDDIGARGWTLSGLQVLDLSEFVHARDLWPLLDERGRALLDEHPLHAAWRKADAEARWKAQLETLREARQADPTAGAAQTLELWQEVKADERRDLLDLLENDLLPEDLPLLKSAEKDRSAEVQKRARMLQGHLPGPLQDELLALLPQAVKEQGKGWKMLPFDLPDAVGKIKTNAYDDSDHHRLLGALPFHLILQTLGLEAEALAVAAEKKHWHLGNFVREQVEQDKQRRRGQAEKLPIILTAAQAAQWLASIQEKGLGDSSTLDRFACLLDPADEIPAPQPLPFVLPPAPTMPKERRLQWEENMQTQHAQRQAEAEAAWRTLSNVLRLRREWVRALEGITYTDSA